MELDFTYNSGGREKYFKQEKVGDCVCRAIAIATDMDYLEVYNLINDYAKKEHISKRKKKKSSARNGVYRNSYDKLLKDLGWTFIPLMTIGSGCQVHLRANEIPMHDTIICRLSKHLTCVKSGVINDTYNCSRGGSRCVYGYYIKERKEEKKVNNITIEDIKDYIKELKIGKEVVENQLIKNQELVNWYNKQINYFEEKLRGVENE